MPRNPLKILFWFLAVLMLTGLLWVSRDAGISGDEEVHYRQSEMVYNFFKTLGADQSSVNTPQTHLQYYGQAYDNLTTILIHWLGIEDIYSFRHLMCSIAGWLTIVVTALFAASISGYGAAIVVLLLFLSSPTFLGHTQNNLKDIPFALAYIASIYYSLKLVYSEGKVDKKTVILLILSIGLAIGIRPGGLLSVFYLGLFMFIKTAVHWIKYKTMDVKHIKSCFRLFAVVSISGFLLSIVLWPYALQNPFLHTWKSYQVMTSFPTTVRQIFEGHYDWSDYHPWYYLPKYMLITIPLIVFTGMAILFIAYNKKNFSTDQKQQILLVVFTIVFPIVFVLLKQSNLYGSWRHFLFVYPGMVLLAALGFHALYKRTSITQLSTAVLFLALSIHPVRFMAANHPYYYLYYNELTGGLKGAYTRYETDYYYHSMRAGAEWLQQHLKGHSADKKIIVGGNFPIQWYFRNDKNIQFKYIPYQTRSEYDWDYAIIANSYIPPVQLKNHSWPPGNTIHTINVEGVPVCAVLERTTKDDLLGIEQLKKEDYIKSAYLLEKAIAQDPQNEWIIYKFAQALAAQGKNAQAVAAYKQSLTINPGFEPSLMMLAAQAQIDKDYVQAADYYKRTISANRKYMDAYVQLAAIYAETNVTMARKVLKDCLNVKSRYKPALKALADTYRKSQPEVARKYDELINTIK
ncbi:MAG: tetratricopeptide repeat protein [Methylococcaceae bacterium]